MLFLTLSSIRRQKNVQFDATLNFHDHAKHVHALRNMHAELMGSILYFILFYSSKVISRGSRNPTIKYNYLYITVGATATDRKLQSWDHQHELTDTKDKMRV